MDNEKILEDFFRALKVALTNAFSYSKDHPYFIKSVENLKMKLDEVLAVLSPLVIGVTSSAIVVDGKNLSKAGFYDELARMFHQRKIKSVEIRSGSTLQELVRFLSVVSLPQKDIFKSGGINTVIGNDRLAHFTIEELDYSAFLHGQAHECSDLWGYMLKEAVHSSDSSKLERLADDFGPLINQSSQKDICQNQEAASDINEFLVCLREKNREKFDKCSKDIFLWLLRNKKSLKEEDLEKFKPVFKSFDQKDFAALFLEGVYQEDNFDDLSIQLFSKISQQKEPAKAAENLLQEESQRQLLKNNPNAVKRVQKLLTGSQGDNMSPVYRNILESLVKGISGFGVLSFDQQALRQNYRYILLSLLSVNEDAESRRLAAEALGKELADIFEDKDTGFLKDLCGLLLKRRKEGAGVDAGLEKELSAFIENAVLNQSLSAADEFLLEMVGSTQQGVDYYLDKIFTSEKPSRLVLRLFFRLFEAHHDAFWGRLEEKIQDLDFLSGLIDSLSRIEEPAVLSVLEYIYNLANELIKCEILKVMRNFKRVDVDFLIRHLGTDSVLLRKNLLSVLMLDAKGKEEALDLLLKIPSLWASKNKLLIENMQIVYDLGVVDCAGRLRDLAGRRFFWNRQLRNKAKKILGEWNEL